MFGLYAAFKLFKKGETVMYYHGDNNVYYLLGPKDSPIIAACHEKGFNIPVPEDGVYIGRFRVDGIVGCNRLARFLEVRRNFSTSTTLPRTGSRSASTFSARCWWCRHPSTGRRTI